MNSTLFNPIDEPTHNHHWLALRKEGFVGQPSTTLPPLEGRQALHISTEISQSSVRLFSRSIESAIQWFVHKPLGRLFQGLNALHDRGGDSEVGLITAFD